MSRIEEDKDALIQSQYQHAVALETERKRLLELVNIAKRAFELLLVDRNSKLGALVNEFRDKAKS